MDSLQRMRIFVRVVQAGSLSAAGRAIGLSPASVSRHISALEDQVGGRLINRTSRKLAPTQLGQVYFEKAARVLEQIDEMADLVSEHQGSPRGLLNVHCRISVGSHFLAPALPRFMAAYPDVEVRLWLSEEPRDVIDHNIDVAIRLGNLDEPNLMVRKLCSGVERVLFASPAYLESHPPVREPDDLLGHNCLTFCLDGKLEGGDAAWHFRTADGTSKELRVSGTLQVNDGHFLRQAALAGSGIAVLPAWMVADDLKAGTLVRVLPRSWVTPTTFDHSIYAVYHKSPRLSPKVRVFLDFLAELFQGAEPEMEDAAAAATATNDRPAKRRVA